MRQTIGLFAGAFKPFHLGHYTAIKNIINETDKLILFVSNKDRINKKEHPILWEKMEIIWNKYIIPILPDNIQIIISNNPTTSIFDFLSKVNNNINDHNTYFIFSSIEDLEKTYNNDKLKRLFPRLYKENQLETKKTNTRNIISGKDMRNYIKNNDLLNFVKFLPHPIQRYGTEIFNLLK